MNQSEKVMLSLLRRSLWNTSEQFDSNTDWDGVFRETKVQAVTALAAKSVPTYLTEEQNQKWKDAELTQVARVVQYMFAQDGMCRVLSYASIPFVILKGTAASIYYPEPFRRAMGDIDFLVPQELFSKAMEAMLQAGYVRNRDEHGTERHIGFRKSGIEFEMHHHFSYDDLDIEEYMKQGLLNRDTSMLDGHHFPMMPKLENGIILLAHMRAHLKSGLGLRQMIDWMMYVNSELDDEFWEDVFCNIVRAIHMETLAVTATRTCQLYLGLPETIKWCKNADVELCDLLIDSLLSSGNFGGKNGNGKKVESIYTKIRIKGAFHFIQSAGEYNWMASHNYPWLRSFAWFYQLLRFIRKWPRYRRTTRTMSRDIKNGKARYEMLKRLEIV